MTKKSLSVFMLAMINVAAIGSVKNWPTTAEYGFAAIFFLLLGTLVFFIPTSLVSAELATAWPEIGGIFVWVKEAFGHRTGFLSIWLLWIENVIWYPTMLSFIAATLAFIFDPALAGNKLYTLLISLSIFWIVTWINLRGMRTSGWVSSIGVIAGTFVPGAIIIGLGMLWFFGDRPLQINTDIASFFPNMSSPEQLVFFTGVMLSLCGMEMSAIHAKDVQNPQRNYPKAIFISALIILGMSILGVLSISFVVPQHEISLTAGSMQAFESFVDAYKLHALIPYMAMLVFVGAIASLSTWVVGPSRGLLAAAESGDLPPFFRRVNKQDMPISLLIGQAVIVTFLSLMFILMPTVSAAYWILTVLVAQVYLVMYILMFAAAIKLRYKRPNVFRAYRVPGGNIGMWIVSSLGIISSFFAMVIGFFPPAQIATGNTAFFVGFLVIGMILICLTPSLILVFKKPAWNKPLPHEKR